MEEKCLWGIIDELRDDVNAHIDAITDMDAVNDTYQGEIFKLEAEIKKLNRACLEGSGNIINGLNAEIKELQVENIKLNAEKFDNADVIAEYDNV